MTNEKKYKTHKKHHESFLYGLLLKLTKRNEKNKITNEEKYKTTEERTKAQREFCHSHNCRYCPANKDKHIPCTFAWLALEVEEEKGEKHND